MQIVSGVWREMSAKVNLAVGSGGDGPVSATAAAAATAAAPNRLPPPTPTFYGDNDERTPEKSNRDEECLLTKGLCKSQVRIV